ncbi:Alpha-N-acetylgalactosamine-specific lectin [Holothuria leucospilota]|uniref:Alpha-N-acetylgalactosamine-specific lectin n=1 Tax=Holothuria leucospilota TaxID=206669 RepID=A0A9Q1C8Z1_HOLLE|nr:Alpha-N-acetylgalactosamine-specific lectin [Holothuria leucospilota]
MKYCIVVLAAIIVTFSSVAQAKCIPKWTHWKGHCYRYESQSRKNWTVASDDCKKKSPHGNGHLVTIHSAAENKFVAGWWKEMLGPLRCRKWQYIWIGLNDIDEEGTFVWRDGSPVTYTNWGGNQPDNRFNNSDCATMTVRRPSDPGRWDDGRCFTIRAYVCEYDL